MVSSIKMSQFYAAQALLVGLESRAPQQHQTIIGLVAPFVFELYATIRSTAQRCPDVHLTEVLHHTTRPWRNIDLCLAHP